jgi:hypothetical protein
MATFRIVSVAESHRQQQGWAVQRSDDDGQNWITLIQALPTEEGAKLALERLEAMASLENLPATPSGRR